MPVASERQCGAIMCGSFQTESPDSTMAKAGESPLQGKLVISLAAWEIPQANDSLKDVWKGTFAALLLTQDLTHYGRAKCYPRPATLQLADITNSKAVCPVRSAGKSKGSRPVSHFHRQLQHLPSRLQNLLSGNSLVVNALHHGLVDANDACLAPALEQGAYRHPRDVANAVGRAQTPPESLGSLHVLLSLQHAISMRAGRSRNLSYAAF